MERSGVQGCQGPAQLACEALDNPQGCPLPARVGARNAPLEVYEAYGLIAFWRRWGVVEDVEAARELERWCLCISDLFPAEGRVLDYLMHK